MGKVAQSQNSCFNCIHKKNTPFTDLWCKAQKRTVRTIMKVCKDFIPEVQQEKIGEKKSW